MLDVLIAGAGPAGSIAALVLARAGARVLLVDRAAFPRDKLCGDTLNPGALALLASLQLRGGPIDSAERLNGMRLSGPGTVIASRYGQQVSGRALRRRDLDLWLLEHAMAAGARFQSHVRVAAPLMSESRGRSRVRGLVLAPQSTSGRVCRMPASLVIAADGVRSPLARTLGLMRTPMRPRRWAFGSYFEGVEEIDDLGEMHVRRDAYIGIAPMGSGVANVCVVTGPRPDGRGPIDVMDRAIAAAGLRARFTRARMIERPNVLGPLASDVSLPGVEGLLLAGDAAGFVDPMTGDGLRLAMQGAVLAAREALTAMETADFAGAPRRLAAARAISIGSKLRFNRAIRRLTDTPAAIYAASVGARLAPQLLASAVRYAGDVPDAR